jgi:hypothetical protein
MQLRLRQRPDDADDGPTAESSTIAATRSKSATGKPAGSKPAGAKSSGAKSSDIDKGKGKEPATSTTVEFSSAIEKANEKEEQWDASSTCALSHIRGALPIFMAALSIRTASTLL